MKTIGEYCDYVASQAKKPPEEIGEDLSFVLRETQRMAAALKGAVALLEQRPVSAGIGALRVGWDADAGKFLDVLSEQIATDVVGG